MLMQCVLGERVLAQVFVWSETARASRGQCWLFSSLCSTSMRQCWNRTWCRPATRPTVRSWLVHRPSLRVRKGTGTLCWKETPLAKQEALVGRRTASNGRLGQGLGSGRSMRDPAFRCYRDVANVRPGVKLAPRIHTHTHTSREIVLSLRLMGDPEGQCREWSNCYGEKVWSGSDTIRPNGRVEKAISCECKVGRIQVVVVMYRLLNASTTIAALETLHR